MGTGNGEYPVRYVHFKKDARFIHLTIEFAREGDVVTAECVELGTTQFGDTFDEANEAIIDAVGLHLNELDDAGELGRFCAEHNIDIFEEPRRWSVAYEGERVKVPA